MKALKTMLERKGAKVEEIRGGYIAQIGKTAVKVAKSIHGGYIVRADGDGYLCQIYANPKDGSQPIGTRPLRLAKDDISEVINFNK